MTSTPSLSSVECRRALEALRSGVPNRDAVKVLGSGQPEVERRFAERLAKLSADGRAAPILVSGGFGTGKSHLLEALEHHALSSNCVVSRVVISKETPLYDVAKVYRAAADAAVVSGRRGHALQEIAHSLRPGTQRYAEFFDWTNSPQSGLAQLFPATLLLHRKLNDDPELVDEVISFWAGDRIAIPRIRQGLRQLGAAQQFAVTTVPLKQLAVQRFRFVSNLIRAAGFAGWVVMFDELELVGRYTPLQRARSYAEIGRWLGYQDGDDPIAVVGAITDDFAAAVVDAKGDRESAAERLREKDSMDVANAAIAGIRALDFDALALQRPDESVLQRIYTRLQDVHALAYGWQPPDLAHLAPTVQRPIRAYVRRWTNEWDLRRLFPGTTLQTDETALSTNYETDSELESESES